MKHIAMLNCLNANKYCTGAACFQAFHNKGAFFKEYEDQEICLDAFMRCNGCGIDPKTDVGMLEKIERLKNIGIQIVHIGKCTKQTNGKECPTITAIAELMKQQGIEIVRGTH